MLTHRESPHVFCWTPPPGASDAGPDRNSGAEAEEGEDGGGAGGNGGGGGGAGRGGRAVEGSGYLGIPKLCGFLMNMQRKSLVGEGEGQLDVRKGLAVSWEASIVWSHNLPWWERGAESVLRAPKFGFPTRSRLSPILPLLFLFRAFINNHLIMCILHVYWRLSPLDRNLLGSGSLLFTVVPWSLIWYLAKYLGLCKYLLKSVITKQTWHVI